MSLEVSVNIRGIHRVSSEEAWSQFILCDGTPRLVTDGQRNAGTVAYSALALRRADKK